VISACLLAASIKLERSGIGLNLVGDIFDHRSWRSFIRHKHSARIPHQTKLNREPKLIVPTPANRYFYPIFL
jgi:hypothetical protein